MDTPSIYVACLASYNNVILLGVWIDATQSEDDIMKEIWEMADNRPKPMLRNTPYMIMKD